MVTKNMWEYIYNAVFSLFLPPEDIIKKIIYNDDGDIKEFKSIIEFMAYMALNTDKEVVQKNISFILKNDSLYNKCRNYHENVCKTMKERY